MPSGTVATGDDWGLQEETQLDSVTATRKLIVAAQLYGREQVGSYATEFAAHGMIEVRWIYLLKGPPIEAAKPLDEYCKLLPYAEALRRIGEQTDPTDLRTEWPEPHSDNVCALEGRYCERASVQGTEYGQYTSPFLKDGPEQLALLLGLVWGCGFQILGNWRGAHPAAVAALPYRSATVGSGAGSRHVTLPLQGYGPPIQRRPLALKELREFTAKYSELPASGRTRLAKAMGNLRDSTQRIQYKDKVVDVGVALSTLFSGDAEEDDLTALVPKKGGVVLLGFREREAGNREHAQRVLRRLLESGAWT